MVNDEFAPAPPPSVDHPCWVCGTTNPADHGPDDACPDLAADAVWLDAQRRK